MLKQTHDKNSPENFSPTTHKLRQVFKKLDSEDGNTQTQGIQNIIGTQSLRDTLVLLRRSKKIFKFVEKDNGDVFWNGVLIQPFGENRVEIKKNEFSVPS